MNKDLLYQLALTQVPKIGLVRAKILMQHFPTAEAIFTTPVKQLAKIESIGSHAAQQIASFSDFDSCEKEIAFIEKHNIQVFSIHDPQYPRRLLHCYDAPALLFFKGQANLNAARVISIVGTRQNSEYGKEFCERLLSDLQDSGILVVSGLAFGMDTIAHKNAIKQQLATVAVVAHGLDRIYPAENKGLAQQMVKHGGILTDFITDTRPDKQNFPKRNRIVAGICDALLVIESGIKGGSLITAELANSYNKDVFALPGRTIDARSEGCNYLIKTNKAQLISNAKDLLNAMNWNENTQPIKKQRTLFLDLPHDQKIIFDILQQQEKIHIDDLYLKTSLSSSNVAQALLMLEMEGVVKSLPGKMYQSI